MFASFPPILSPFSLMCSCSRRDVDLLMSMTPLQARHSSLVPHSWKAGWFGGSLEVYLLSFSFPAKNVCRFWRFWHDWFSSIPPGTLLPWWWMCVYSSIDRWMQAPQSMDVDSVASHGPWFKLSKRGFTQSGLQGFLGLHQFSFDRKNNVTFSWRSVRAQTFAVRGQRRSLSRLRAPALELIEEALLFHTILCI